MLKNNKVKLGTVRKFVFIIIFVLFLFLPVFAQDKGYKYLDSQGNLKEIINKGRTVEERDYSKGSINIQHNINDEGNKLRLLDSKGGLTDFIDKGSTIEKRDYSKGTIEILNKVGGE